MAEHPWLASPRCGGRDDEGKQDKESTCTGEGDRPRFDLPRESNAPSGALGIQRERRD
jgi:hypothetical protein